MDDVIRLNVGGTSFCTTRSTLLRDPACLFAKILETEDDVASIVHLDDGSIFIDRDGAMFVHILQYMRSGKLILPENFKDLSRLMDEAHFFNMKILQEEIGATLSPRASLKVSAMANGNLLGMAETGGYITLGYRGTFAFGRDGQADVKFRKLHRILVCGKVALCREVFSDTLNESRDPGDRDGSERYTSRLYLKHQCLERACDAMAEKGFKLVATCCSGANGLAAPNAPTSQQGPPSQTDLMTLRNSGDYEEQRWAHYTEYVFYREPRMPGDSPRAHSPANPNRTQND
ncbi:unnamed protein product, partial [Mesorhabditis belari]|uniref:BTB domain-containing protein n=1 Tax=Mesorhabditis belari TaxID=2138241 RepID=A0AAF3F014_9BILA